MSGMFFSYLVFSHGPKRPRCQPYILWNHIILRIKETSDLCIIFNDFMKSPMGLRLGLECEGQKLFQASVSYVLFKGVFRVEHLYLVILFVFLFFVCLKESAEVWLKSFLSFPGRKMLNPIMLCVITLMRGFFFFFFQSCRNRTESNSRVFQEHLLLWSLQMAYFWLRDLLLWMFHS